MNTNNFLNKKKAHLEHITSAFHGLNEKYSLLEPMLFDEHLARKYNNYGYTVIRQSLFFNCVMDIVNIVKQIDARTPSIEGISEIFSNDGIIKVLHDNIVYSDAFKGIEYYEKSQSSAFNINVKKTKEAIKNLLQLEIYKSFVTIRDKRIAHLELKHENEMYKLLDISTLNLKWTDLKIIIDRLKIIVKNLNIILTGVNIADRDQINQKMKNEYWYPLS